MRNLAESNKSAYDIDRHIRGTRTERKPNAEPAVYSGDAIARPFVYYASSDRATLL